MSGEAAFHKIAERFYNLKKFEQGRDNESGIDCCCNAEWFITVGMDRCRRKHKQEQQAVAGRNIQAIQVSADISDPITRERECRALYEAGSAMPDAHLLLINISEESTIKTESGTIHIIPAWKWLLKS